MGQRNRQIAKLSMIALKYGPVQEANLLTLATRFEYPQAVTSNPKIFWNGWLVAVRIKSMMIDLQIKDRENLVRGHVNFWIGGSDQINPSLVLVSSQPTSADTRVNFTQSLNFSQRMLGTGKPR